MPPTSRNPAIALLQLILLLSPSATGAQSPIASSADSMHVLFIGNSYTYFTNLPRLVQGMAEGDPAGRPLAVAMAAPGGMTLEGHRRRPETLRSLQSRSWDVVVLQEQSQLGAPSSSSADAPPRDAGTFKASARALDSIVRATGARRLFYQTWSREHQPEHTDLIAEAYEAIARELGAAMAPVGRAFAIVRRERPDLRLTIEDRSHPSTTGSYLAACVIYRVISGRTVVGRPSMVRGTPLGMDGNPVAGPPVTMVDLPPADARYLQGVAERAVRTWGRPLAQD